MQIGNFWPLTFEIVFSEKTANPQLISDLIFFVMKTEIHVILIWAEMFQNFNRILAGIRLQIYLWRHFDPAAVFSEKFSVNNPERFTISSHFLCLKWVEKTGIF